MKPKIIVIIVVLALVVVGLVWYIKKSGDEIKSSPAPSSNSAKSEDTAQPAVETKKDESLGAEVYGKLENPVKGEVPETNPYKQEYVNPFE